MALQAPRRLHVASTVTNPKPDITEAAQAARDYLEARGEHLKLAMGIRAKREAKRAVFAATALVFGLLALVFFVFWIGNEIHEAGAPSWTVALGNLIVLGGIAGILLMLAQKPAPHATKGAI
jgi:hypothetical protein